MFKFEEKHKNIKGSDWPNNSSELLIDSIFTIAVKALFCTTFLVCMLLVFGIDVLFNHKSYLLNIADRDADGIVFDVSGFYFLIEGGWYGIIKQDGGLIDIPFRGLAFIVSVIGGIYAIVTFDSAPKPRRQTRS